MKVIKIEDETDKNITFLCNRVGCTKKNFVKIVMKYLTYEQLENIWSRKIYNKNTNRNYIKDKDDNVRNKDDWEEFETDKKDKKIEWEELSKLECTKRGICYTCHKTIENCECGNLGGFMPTERDIYNREKNRDENIEEEDEEIEWDEDDDVIEWDDDEDEEEDKEEWEELSKEVCVERKICFDCHKTITNCTCGNLDGFPALGDSQLS